jgi:phosphate transport system substrate-binding protein
MNKLLIGLLVITILALVVGGCNKEKPNDTQSGTPEAPTGASAKAVSIKGSDTMVNLGTALAEEYSLTTKAPVTVAGGGSGVGINALTTGDTDICEASREIKAEEMEQANKNGVTPVEHVIAFDGIAIIVNKKNPLKEITLKQIADLFTGKTANWKDAGGANGSVVLLSREATSGTHVFLKEHVMQRFDKKAEYAKAARFLPSNQAIHDEVEQNVNAIGYIGLGYVDDKIKVLPVALEDGKPFVTPSVDTIKDKSYPVSRPLYWYTNGEPTGNVASLLEFALGDAGQKIVADQGFVPVK